MAPVVIQKEGITFLPWVMLTWSCNEITEATIGQCVLVREKSVIGGHAELVPPGHGLCNQITSHLSCCCGIYRLADEEPDVYTVS
jgi:hypothetical protein